MVPAKQIAFGLLASTLPHPPVVGNEPKLIAIVGAGSAGLAALNTLLQYNVDHQANWTVVLFEQRRDVGGIWLPNTYHVEPPDIPKTPLYPNLHTNTPVPSMTYPGPNHTFPEGTPLYPGFQHVWKYHQRYAQDQNLYPHIRLNHTVTWARWVGNSSIGHWELGTIKQGERLVQHRRFDHLVVAAGNNHYPHIPTWSGQDEWLASDSRRKIIHSVWYHGPEPFNGKKVLVVGSRSSGVDIASQLASACTVHISTRTELERAVDPRVVVRPEVSHFNARGVVFRDGTTFYADIVLLGTGYDLRFPFLESKNALAIKPGGTRGSHPRLTTNLRYIFPLHEHIFSLDASYPVTALSFVGLPIFVANCPSDVAQSIYLTHIIANPSLLGDRKELLQKLSDREEGLRKHGHDPYYIGHRLLDGYSFDYQDQLIEFLKSKGAIPDDGQKFVESWRRNLISQAAYLRRGWLRVEELGTEKEWLEGVSTESEWVSLMDRLYKWQKEWEDSN